MSTSKALEVTEGGHSSKGFEVLLKGTIVSEGNVQPPAGLLRSCRRRIASNICLRLRCTAMYGNKNKRLFLVHYT